MNCSRRLERGFQALARPTQDGGFWDSESGTFARSRLGVCGERGFEAPDERYTPFGLAGALRAHRQSGLGDEAKLRQASEWAINAIPNVRDLDNLYYGGVWALAEAALTFNDERYALAAIGCVTQTREAYLQSEDLNGGVGLFALATLCQSGMATDAERDVVARKAGTFGRAVNARGIPATGDRRACYHQRLMYCVWGLAAAAKYLGDPKLAAAAGRILDFVAWNRVDGDAGIRWHAILERDVMPRGGVRIFPWGHHIFYECHQCFYASAVELFTDASGDRRFEALRFRALNFIFGDNRWRLPLDEIGLQGLPVRCVSKGGSVTLWRNQFKGCYEVGAYLWALSSAVRDETSS